MAASLEKLVEEGFRPLRKAQSEPSRTYVGRVRERGLVRQAQAEGAWATLERKISFTSATPAEAPPSSDSEAVVVVDPFSSGALIAAGLAARGFRVLRVFSEMDSPVANFVQDGVAAAFDATFQFDSTAKDKKEAAAELAKSIKELPYRLLAVIPGAETGVLVADQLASQLNMRSNPLELSVARRNKYVMGETVRAAGLRAVKQLRATAWPEIAAFLEEWNPSPFLAVVKPIESAGSDDVFKCTSVADVRKAFETINGKINGLGTVNEGVLVQEFLAGTEYVVDSVSRDGVHKTLALWEYDKRSVNDANFVYFGMSLRPASGEREQALIEYSNRVLDALGFVNGPGHMEVMWLDAESQPCLVEVGSRCHGGEGTWQPIAQECVGHDQITSTLDVYVDPDAFDALPLQPTEMKKYGREVFLVARQNGMLRALAGDSEIRAMRSFRKLDMQVRPGGFVSRTTDCFTRPGSVQLVHEDEAVVLADHARIRALEVAGLFDFAVICPKPISTGIIAIVDPFSSGAKLAQQAIARGFEVAIVLAEVDSPFAASFAAGGVGSGAPTIQHQSDAADIPVALSATSAAIAALPSPLLACIPGAETGVLVADQLAPRLNMRSNPLELSVARRNKYVMGETVRAAGLRAVKQLRATAWPEIAAFLEEWNPSPFLAVVKPIESAGSDDVFKCTSVADVRKAFETINGKINGLGTVNEGVLVQEFLAGTEYVVDSVSRDGVHKTLALWEYDKRSVNDANFVYFGMSLRPASGEREQALIEYSNRVLDALGFVNGPGHMEVMWLDAESQPCLVEVGSRCHGGEGTWQPIAQECVGHDQITSTLDVYVDPDAFDALPLQPTEMKKYGREVFLVARQNGVCASLPGVAEIRAMRSFRKLDMHVQPGSTVVPTIDCFTRPGSVQLVHEDEAIVLADHARIRALEGAGLFEFAG